MPRLDDARADYTVDEKARAVRSRRGHREAREALGIDNIYAPRELPADALHGRRAQGAVIYQRDRDYVVKDGEVVIVDEFTGRLMSGRRWSDGLHQAVEAKEGVQDPATRTSRYATITLPELLPPVRQARRHDRHRRRPRREEFHKIYKLDVVVIPTNRPMVREDDDDLVYKTEKAKFDAVVEEIVEARDGPAGAGRHGLDREVGVSGGAAERKGVEHKVLNAKQHEREAAIVAEAGQHGAVTIATNMAGRGTDIMLGGKPDGRTGEWQASTTSRRGRRAAHHRHRAARVAADRQPAARPRRAARATRQLALLRLASRTTYAPVRAGLAAGHDGASSAWTRTCRSSRGWVTQGDREARRRRSRATTSTSASTSSSTTT